MEPLSYSAPGKSEVGFFSSILPGWGSQALTAVPFPCSRDAVSCVFELCHLAGRGGVCRVPFSRCSVSKRVYVDHMSNSGRWQIDIFSQQSVKFLLWKPGFLQRPSCPWVSAQLHILQVPPGHGQEALEPVHRGLQLTKLISWSACLLPEARGRGLPVPLCLTNLRCLPSSPGVSALMFNVSMIPRSVDNELAFPLIPVFVYTNLGWPSNSPGVSAQSWDVSLNIHTWLLIPGMSPSFPRYIYTEHGCLPTHPTPFATLAYRISLIPRVVYTGLACFTVS